MSQFIVAYDGEHTVRIYNDGSVPHFENSGFKEVGAFELDIDPVSGRVGPGVSLVGPNNDHIFVWEAMKVMDAKDFVYDRTWVFEDKASNDPILTSEYNDGHIPTTADIERRNRAGFNKPILATTNSAPIEDIKESGPIGGDYEYQSENENNYRNFEQFQNLDSQTTPLNNSGTGAGAVMEGQEINEPEQTIAEPVINPIVTEIDPSQTQSGQEQAAKDAASEAETVSEAEEAETQSEPEASNENPFSGSGDEQVFEETPVTEEEEEKEVVSASDNQNDESDNEHTNEHDNGEPK